jgi:nucleotide-binding universal stress UspA family protein
MSIFPTTILLATDGSREAQLATTEAAELTNSTNSELHIVYVEKLWPTALAETDVEPEANPVRVFWYGLSTAFAAVLIALGVGALVLFVDVLWSGQIHRPFVIGSGVIAAVAFDRWVRRYLPLSASSLETVWQEGEARRRERGRAHPEREGQDVFEQRVKRAQDLLDQQVKSVEEAGATVKEAHLRLGQPDEEILELADEVGAGLIVMGSRGSGGIRRALMGSVSDSVVKHAHSPVLIVRE